MWARKGTRPGDWEMAQVVQDYLRRVGFDLKIQILDGATWRAKATVPPEKSEYDMVQLGMAAFTGDVSWFVNFGYSTDGWAPKYYNRGYYTNTEIDKLAKQFNSAVTDEKRLQYAKQIQEVAFEDPPVLQLINSIDFIAVQNNVFGVTFDPAGELHYPQFAWKEQR